MKNYKIKRIVKAFLFNKDEILLYQRDNNPNICYPEYWDLIGGSVEAGESDISALEREIDEEIGCKARNIRNIGFVEDPYKKTRELFHIELFVGSIDMPIKKINLTEGQRADYFKIEDIFKINLCDCYKRFIRDSEVDLHQLCKSLI